MRFEPLGTPKVSYADRNGEFVRAAHEGRYCVVVTLSPVWGEGAPVPEEQPAFEIAVTVSGSKSGEPVRVPSNAPAPVSSTWTPSSTVPVSGIGLITKDSPFPWWVLAMTGGVVLFGLFVVVWCFAGRGCGQEVTFVTRFRHGAMCCSTFNLMWCSEGEGAMPRTGWIKPGVCRPMLVMAASVTVALPIALLSASACGAAAAPPPYERTTTPPISTPAPPPPPAPVEACRALPCGG